MNLTRNTLKDLIKEVVKDNKKPSMILSEMATFASAKNKINNEKKTFAVFNLCLHSKFKYGSFKSST